MVFGLRGAWRLVSPERLAPTVGVLTLRTFLIGNNRLSSFRMDEGSHVRNEHHGHANGYPGPERIRHTQQHGLVYAGGNKNGRKRQHHQQDGGRATDSPDESIVFHGVSLVDS